MFRNKQSIHRGMECLLSGGSGSSGSDRASDRASGSALDGDSSSGSDSLVNV